MGHAGSKRPCVSSLGSTGCIAMQSSMRSLEYMAGACTSGGHQYQGCLEEIGQQHSHPSASAR